MKTSLIVYTWIHKARAQKTRQCRNINACKINISIPRPHPFGIVTKKFVTLTKLGSIRPRTWPIIFKIKAYNRWVINPSSFSVSSFKNLQPPSRSFGGMLRSGEVSIFVSPMFVFEFEFMYELLFVYILISIIMCIIKKVLYGCIICALRVHNAPCLGGWHIVHLGYFTSWFDTRGWWFNPHGHQINNHSHN